MPVKLDGFRRALDAALNGPSIKDVEWTTFGHDFNVKKVEITRSGDGGLVIDGTEGKHISHRLRFRPDDQVFYKCRVTPAGKVEDLEINIRSSLDVLTEWFKAIRDLAALIAVIVAKADQAGGGAAAAPMPAASTEEMLDGDWKGDAEFMIANVIAHAVAREMPEVKDRAPFDAGITIDLKVLDPAIVAAFQDAKARLGAAASA